MVTPALQALEEKIDSIIETMELFALQIDELEQQQVELKQRNTQLSGQKEEWETTISQLLNKLSGFQKALPNRFQVSTEEVVY